MTSMNKIKAYKGFNYDWTCNGFQFEVGKTYTHEGEIELCSRGFHACKNPLDCWRYYENMPWNKWAEVELSGDKQEATNNSKVCAQTITIVRELSFDEFVELVKEIAVSNSKAVRSSTAVSGSIAVSDSTAVSNSIAVSGSIAVSNSTAVSNSAAVNNSAAVSGSIAVSDSAAVSDSIAVSYSAAVNNSKAVSNSKAVRSSEAVNSSIAVSYSTAVSNSAVVNGSIAVRDSFFVYKYNPKPLLFNKPSTPERVAEVTAKYKSLCGVWTPAPTNLTALYLKKRPRLD